MLLKSSLKFTSARSVAGLLLYPFCSVLLVGAVVVVWPDILKVDYVSQCWQAHSEYGSFVISFCTLKLTIS